MDRIGESSHGHVHSHSIDGERGVEHGQRAVGADARVGISIGVFIDGGDVGSVVVIVGASARSEWLQRVFFVIVPAGRGEVVIIIMVDNYFVGIVIDLGHHGTSSQLLHAAHFDAPFSSSVIGIVVHARVVHRVVEAVVGICAVESIRYLRSHSLHGVEAGGAGVGANGPPFVVVVVVVEMVWAWFHLLAVASYLNILIARS